MNSSQQDKIPSWVGRAVTTGEIAVAEPFERTGLGTPTGDDAPNDSAADALIETEELEASEVPTQALPGALDEELTGLETEEIAPPAPSSDDAFESSAYTSVRQDPLDRPKGGRPSRTRRILIGAALGTILAGSVVGASLLLGDRGDNADSVSSGEQPPAADSAADGESDLTDVDSADGTTALTVQTDENVDSGGEDVPSRMAVPNLSSATISAHRSEALDAGQPAWAIYTDGAIYLQGELPAEDAGEVLTARLETLLGPGNVVDQLEIAPDASIPTDPPLFIKETVVFAPGETTMPPGSDWILVVADVLMKRYPSTTLTVVANTGNLDGEVETEELAVERLETIVDYLIDRGITADRLSSEVRPGVDAGTVDGNKPIEFIVRGLLVDAPDSVDESESPDEGDPAAGDGG